MKAYGFSTPFIETEHNYVNQIETTEQPLKEYDIEVEVKAVATNPVDTKVRINGDLDPKNPRILGYDAAGIIRKVGIKVTRFKPSDEVYYAGDITRAGSFAESQIVDERIVGKKPKSLSFTQAAALPLTTITAWELLFDRFSISKDKTASGTLLIIGGAGGVGSILIQLARKLTDLTIIATASRPETINWCKKMGADHTINHAQPMAEQLKAIGLNEIDYAAALTHTGQHYKALIEMMKPGGRIGAIDDPGAIDISALKLKALSFHWEFMFSRSMFQTADMIEQGLLLDTVSDMVDAGEIQTTAIQNFGEISQENLNKALTFQASGKAIGKSVLGADA